LLEDLTKTIQKLNQPTLDEQILGKAKIIAEFTIKGDRIAGCQVTQGKLTQGDTVHLVRSKKTISDSKIKSLQQNKKPADQVKKDQECGIFLSPAVEFKLKDTLVAFK